ncbi:hypothetical protein [Apilactobacillus micheneri]|uniref:hypothetical protein n=1 Tax=Apilactobacillus micheneri TaxID=1899430 RepID=UPI0015E863A2|nr:hypothetical protein [Apilactobacillus micheneri]
MDKLEQINKEKQFLISQLGEKKLNKLIAALDKFCVENNIYSYQLKDVASFYRKVNELP